MKFLLSNDDGYFSPGLKALESAASALGKTMVVAPERDRSGASNSLTLDRPMYMRQAASGFYYVNGTPTDCIHLAVTGELCPFKPDLILSGINHGANMGDDTLYSGTVAAAMEGFLLGIPAIATSLASRECRYFDTAAQVVTDLITRIQAEPLQHPVLLNVNVPDIPYEQIRGIKLTRLGRRHRDVGVMQLKNPRGEVIYWIGPAGSASDAGDGTDFAAIAAHYVSVTPLQVDLTSFAHLNHFKTWFTS
jgi:5'-nucleotidase